MIVNRMKSKLVRVTFERGREGLFYAESPDLKGLFVAAESVEKLRAEIPLIIQRLYAACETDVIVTEIESDDDDSWVAIPTAALAGKLSASA
jgi:hypothetical protein